MALTKVTGQVINSTTDLSVGVATVGGGTSTGDLYVVGVTTFSGDVSVGGTLTYEDVTNVDSVGLITARKGITVTANGLYVNAGISTFNADVKVGSGITLSPDGHVYTSGITTIATKLGIGSVHLGGTATDGLLTIKGDTDNHATPSIRLLDGADAREVSISNTSGDFVASTHGADNNEHGHLKVFESGIIQFANGGASGSITERLRITVDGKILTGHTSGSVISTYGFESVNTTGNNFGAGRFVAGSGGPDFWFLKSRNATIGSHTVVQDGDTTGTIQFAGSDGDSYTRTASIVSQVDGSPGDGDMPGRLIFQTTADGASSPTERARITSNGDLALGHTSAARGPLHIHKAAADCYFHMTNSTTGTTSGDGFTLHQGGVETIINNREAGNMRFYTNATERVRIDMNGNTNITGITTATHFNPTGQPYGTKNLIINGSMQVAQRATSSTTSGYGSLDRWNVTMGNTDEAFTHSKIDLTSSDTGPWAEGFHNAMRIQNGNQTSGWQTNSHGVLHQFIEDQNIAQSGWQIESPSSYITVSYWIRSTVAQAFGGHIETYDGTDKTWLWSTGTLSANTWTKIVKTIGGDSALSMSDNNGRGLQIQPWFIWGTDYTASDATIGSWATFNGGKRFTDMTSTWWTTNNAQVDITGVQIEVGKVQTPFEHKSYADHLHDCQRYYQQLPVSGDHVIWGFGRAEGNSARVQIPLSRPLLQSPTITCSANRSVKYDATMVQSTTAPTVFKWDADFASIVLDFPSGGSLSHNNCYIVTSDSGSKLQMNAEL